MTLRSHPSFPRHCVEELESRVCLSPTVTTDMLLAGSAFDIHDLLSVGAERSLKDSCTDDASLHSSMTADLERTEQSKCPRQKGERQEVLIIEDDVIVRFRESSLPDLLRREETPSADAIDAYLGDRDSFGVIAPDVRRLPSIPLSSAEHAATFMRPRAASSDLLHDAVLEDIFADGPVLSSVLIDRYLGEERNAEEEPWSPLRDRLRLWEPVPQKVETEENAKKNERDTKEQGEASENPSQDDNAPMREEVPRLRVVPRDEQPEGTSIESAEPSANTKPSTSSSSILSRGIGGVRSLASRAWGGLRRLIAA